MKTESSFTFADLETSPRDGDNPAAQQDRRAAGRVAGVRQPDGHQGGLAEALAAPPEAGRPGTQAGGQVDGWMLYSEVHISL